MEVIVSAIVCIGVCMGLVCGCKMKCITLSKGGLPNMSEAQWAHYFNEGGDI